MTPMIFPRTHAHNFGVSHRTKLPSMTLSCNSPIWDGDKPFLASLEISVITSSGVILDQFGCDLRYGRAEEEIPFPGACIL